MKVYINKDKLPLIEGNISKDLTSFIMDDVYNHQTSLSYTDMFPEMEGESFCYSLLNKRFSEIKNNLLQFNDIKSTNEDYLVSYLSHLITKAKEIEKPIETVLIKKCENIITNLFNIPEESVIFDCKLVNKIEPKEGAIRLLPEDNQKIDDFDFSQLTSYKEIKSLISKRRIINSLIQGASYTLGSNFEIYDIDNEELIEIYKRIIAINDFILFTIKERVTDKSPKQGAYVEVLLARENEKTEIHSQGIVFPLLVIETIRGFFELFASHGLPKDNQLAREVISHSDFLLAEPWDLRFGVSLWKKAVTNNTTTQALPYYFTDLCKLHNNEFKETFKGIINGESNLNDELMVNAEKEVKYNDFTDFMQQKNAEFSVITDDITNPEDLDKIELSEDYRQLSIPFDGSVWKYNYEYYIDYLEKIGKKGTLPPDKDTQKHGVNVSYNINWEYELNQMIYKMYDATNIRDMFVEYIREYCDESVLKEQEKIELEQEVYDILYELLFDDSDADIYDEEDEDGYQSYNYDLTKKAFFEKISNILEEDEDGSIEEYASNLLYDFFNGYNQEQLEERPEIDYELEQEIETQREISNFIECCEDCTYNVQEAYEEIEELLPKIGEDDYSFANAIGGKIEGNMQRLVNKYFEFDENGLIIIERGIKIEELLNKPQELKQSVYHSSLDKYSEGVGNCWSWSKGYGSAYGGNGKGETIVLKGKVRAKDVDWGATCGLYYEYDNEREIRIKANSSIEIDEVILKKDGRHLPFQGPLLVKSGNSWQGCY